MILPEPTGQRLNLRSKPVWIKDGNNTLINTDGIDTVAEKTFGFTKPGENPKKYLQVIMRSGGMHSVHMDMKEFLRLTHEKVVN
jgi:hypothetical protein